MANLYEINQEIMDCIDFDTGEILDSERLSALQMDFNEKVHNIALWIKNLRSEAVAVRKEKEIFAERENKICAKAELLENYLAKALKGSKYSDSQVEISFKKSTSVNIADSEHIPAEYLRVKISKEPDKKAIKSALKQGVVIQGCSLEENNNIIIK